MIESPGGTYPPITAGDFILERIRANYGGVSPQPGSGRQRPAVGGAQVLQPAAGRVRGEAAQKVISRGRSRYPTQESAGSALAAAQAAHRATRSASGSAASSPVFRWASCRR